VATTGRPGQLFRSTRAHLGKRFPRTTAFVEARLTPTKFTGLGLTLMVLAAVYIAALLGGLIDELREADELIQMDKGYQRRPGRIPYGRSRACLCLYHRMGQYFGRCCRGGRDHRPVDGTWPWLPCTAIVGSGAGLAGDDLRRQIRLWPRAPGICDRNHGHHAFVSQRPRRPARLPSTASLPT